MLYLWCDIPHLHAPKSFTREKINFSKQTHSHFRTLPVARGYRAVCGTPAAFSLSDCPPRLLAIPLVLVLYFFAPTRPGLISTDEPRYASNPGHTPGGA